MTMKMKQRIALAVAVLMWAAISVAAQGVSPATPSKEYVYLGGRLIAIETATNGSTIAPFTTTDQWNRADSAQFVTIDSSSPYGTGTIVQDLFTTQPDVAYTTIPMIQFRKVSSSSPLPRWRWFITSSAFAPTSSEDLVIEADVSYYDDPNARHGLGCFDPANPTKNYYVLTNQNGAWQINKVINDVQYNQTARLNVGSGSSAAAQKVRVRFVVTAAGGVRVYIYGISMFDLPMTLGNATVLTSCQVGFIIDAPYGLGYPLAFSRLRIFKVAAGFEPIM